MRIVSFHKSHICTSFFSNGIYVRGICDPGLRALPSRNHKADRVKGISYIVFRTLHPPLNDGDSEVSVRHRPLPIVPEKVLPFC